MLPVGYFYGSRPIDPDNRAILDRPNARIPRGTPTHECTAMEEIGADVGYCVCKGTVIHL
jgi:hypothetical protein